MQDDFQHRSRQEARQRGPLRLQRRREADRAGLAGRGFEDIQRDGDDGLACRCLVRLAEPQACHLHPAIAPAHRVDDGLQLEADAVAINFAGECQQDGVIAGERP